MSYRFFSSSCVITVLAASAGMASCAAGDDCVDVSGDLSGEDVARCAARVEHVEGSLILSEASGELEFPKLVEVGGDIAVYEEGPTMLAFPRLERVEGTVAVTSDELQSVAFPVLEQAGELSVSRAPALRALSAPMLTELGAGIEVVDAAIGELSLPALERVGTDRTGVDEVRVERVDAREPAALRRIRMPKLQEAATVVVRGQEALTEVDLSTLTKVSSSFELVGRVSSTPDSLEVLALPQLAYVGSLEVELTESLHTVSLPALRQADRLRFSANAVLSQVHVSETAEVNQLDATDNPAWCDRAELLDMLQLECNACDDVDASSCSPDPT